MTKCPCQATNSIGLIATTVDCKTIGGNVKALSGYPTIHLILVAEGVSREDYT